MNNQLSNKITHVRFILAVFIIYIHTYSSSFCGVEGFEIEQTFENWFSQGICRVAVPLFFAISGYLLFVKEPQPYGQLLKRKFKTLLIPYLIWNVVNMVFSELCAIVIHQKNLLSFKSVVGGYYYTNLMRRFGIYYN